jgi:hypothetical protein
MHQFGHQVIRDGFGDFPIRDDVCGSVVGELFNEPFIVATSGASANVWVARKFASHSQEQMQMSEAAMRQ